MLSVLITLRYQPLVRPKADRVYKCEALKSKQQDAFDAFRLEVIVNIVRLIAGHFPAARYHLVFRLYFVVKQPLPSFSKR